MDAEPNGDSIDLEFQLSAADYRTASIQLTRRSTPTVAFGAFLIAISIFPVATGDLYSWVTIAFGLSLVSGYFTVPFIWWGIRRRADLLFSVHRFHADHDGIEVVTPMTTTRQSWPTFRRIREGSGLFFLDYGMGANAIVPIRAFDAASLARFRDLVERSTRFERLSGHGPWLRGAAIGVIAAAAFVLIVFVAASIQLAG